MSTLRVILKLPTASAASTVRTTESHVVPDMFKMFRIQPSMPAFCAWRISVMALASFQSPAPGAWPMGRSRSSPPMLANFPPHLKAAGS